MLNLRLALCGLTALGLVACGDPLDVDNVSDADQDRVLSRPADVESFIGATYAQIQNATLGGSNTALQPQMQVMGMENTSALANFAMGPRGAIPRTPIENTRNSTGSEGNFRDYQVLHRAARMATLGLNRLNVLTLGSAPRDARARAFARFTLGVALGNLALAYDSASILTENDDVRSPVPLSGYREVMDSALRNIDLAIAIATANDSAFPLPSAWINGNALSRANFVRFARSYKARFRASVARTPIARRDSVNWAAVIADADSGITADFNITMAPASGWNVIWPDQAFTTGPANWAQMSQFWIGMADQGAGYDAWLATLPALRAPFLVVTPDRRFPQGEERATQVAQVVAGNFTTRPYLRNRPPGEDQPGQPLQISMYDFYRSKAFDLAGNIGPYPIMTRAEIRLLAAEGNLRLGNFAAARDSINVSRVAIGQLPSLAGLADTNTAVPGCVPRVPDEDGAYRVSRCGKLWDALKWEYRMETMFAGYGMWYFAGRGWGDLPEGTAIQFPVPYQEMDTRRQAFYGMGGVNLPGGAAPGNYGLFAGGVY